MAEVYDEIEIEDMDFNEDDNKFYFACPCGDQFQISMVRFIDFFFKVNFRKKWRTVKTQPLVLAAP